MTHAAQALVYATMVDGFYSGTTTRGNGRRRNHSSRRSPRPLIADQFLP